jgi:restriction endonuclease S subunit
MNTSTIRFKVLDHSLLDIEFFKIFLATNNFKSQLRKLITGSAQLNFGPSHLRKIEIPTPPLNDQIRIAHLLGKVEGLIAQRKQHLQQLDDLLKSVFLEMFGDPIRNENGWDKKPLAKLGNLDRGVSKHRPRNAPELLGGSYPLIQTGEVSNAGTYITVFTQTYSDLGFSQSKLWPAGTLCITIAANIAQTGILTFDACFPDSVVGFSADEEESNPLYVLGLLWFFQRILEKNAPAAAQKNINLKILRELEVPAPPIELQNQFATTVENVEGLKSRYQISLTDLENLYGALSQKAFKGELDLSRVPLEPTQKNQEKHNAEPEKATDLMKSIDKIMGPYEKIHRKIGLPESIRRMIELPKPMNRAAALIEATEKEMAQIPLPAIQVVESVRLASETAKRLQSSIPDFNTWQQQAMDEGNPDLDDSDEPINRTFTREDVIAIFAQATDPMAFDSLLEHLAKLESVDLANYEAIKDTLFALLAAQELSQQFDEETKTLLFKAHSTKAAQ